MSLPWHKWYHGTWLSSETHFSMNLAQRGLYRDCSDLHYQEGSIPADPVILRRMLGVDREEFEEAWPRVSEQFRPSTEDPNRLVNEKVLEVLLQSAEFRENQAAKGRLGGRPKGSKKPDKSHGKATVKPGQSRSLAAVKPDKSHKEEEGTSSRFPSAHSSMSKWGDLFAQWWEIFPRKVAKADAQKAYQLLIVEGKVKPEQRDDLKPHPNFADRHGQLVTATKRWANLEFSKRDADKIPYPATFLRKLDWLSAPELPAAPRPETDDEVCERLARTPPPALSYESHETYQARLRREGYSA